MSPNSIAIVGMAGRFPGARDVERFWENLAAGVESITFFSEQELRAAGVEAELLADPAYVRARSVVEGAEMFDAAFFDVSPREAEVIDPQQRLLLECAWEALEHAGYDPRRFPGPIGVFAGASLNTYLLSNLQHNPEVMKAVGLFQTMVGSCGDFLATRISYKIGLRGPSLTVQTACSTTLVAIHLAVQSLLNGECDMALAGGVRLLVPRRGGHLYQSGGIFSRDGHCRAFDAAATGTTEGEGCGLVVLKRLADAVADGDHVHAVILGSAINNDGSAKMGYTMPSVEGQAEVIALAQALAGIDPGTIGFIEAHGTGTPLGDPIEVAALSRVFSKVAGRKFPCALGSLKSNLGHLDTAAGVASLIKAALAVEHGLIPPSLHFDQPNPQIDFASGPFYVPVQATPWPGDGPRRAGVSSYGFGGTNAHLVLEEAPRLLPGSTSRPRQLLTLSAPTPSALEKISENLAGHLRRHPEVGLADVAYTLQMGRVPFGYRRIVVCEDMADAVDVLSALDPKRVLTRASEAGDRPVFFLFPGQGAQYPGMGADLYRSEPVFRGEVDRCAEILRPWLGLDLRQVLYPEGGDPAEAAARLEQTALAQPALFVVEHALARLWMQWGVRPEAMLGHSIGEYVAACLAGVFSLEDALRLVAERGRLMQEMPSGSMLAVSLPEMELRPLLGGLSLAAINGPALCVVSGESGAVEDLAARLAGSGVQARRLHTSHAFHSAAMEPLLPSFEAAFAGLRLGAPDIPFLSNLTGTWIRPEEATAPRYWMRHLRETVRFSEGLEALCARPSPVFLEIGPGKALTSLVRQRLKGPAAPSALASLPAAGDRGRADAAVLRTLGQLWMAGVEIDWVGFYSGERRVRVPLPTYPFERQRYWVEPAPGKGQVGQRTADGARELADWFWVPLWHQALPPGGSELPEGAAAGTWLVFTDETGLGDRLAARLRERGGEVATVRAGERFQAEGRGGFVIRPGEAADYGDLLAQLSREGMEPARIIHLWSVVEPIESAGSIADAERDQERGFFSLLHLAQALGDRPPVEARPALHLGIVSTGVHQITGAEDLAPARATLLGPATTLPQEYPGITCAAIDVTLLPPGSQREERLVDLLIAELAASETSPVVAYRGTGRWLRTFEPLRLESPRGPLPLRESGTYLITGGLGGVGLELAGLLARSARVRLVLSSRASFAEREEWPVLAQGEGLAARVARRLLDLEAAGAEVWVAAADVTDAASMRRLFSEARQRFGRIDGVIHAAGLAGGGLMRGRSSAAAAAALAPKVRGTLVLEELLAGEARDFLVLCSSLNGLVGGPGQLDATAANAFLDAFAQSRAGKLPVVSINWSSWRGIGMAARQPPQIEERLEAMGPEQAVEAFRRILAVGHLPQIAVSVQPLPQVLERARSMTAGRAVQAASPESGGGHVRPELKISYVAPRGELEERLAAIWGNVLGLDRVGTADDFFELGGHSLLGTQLVSRVREVFGIDVPLGQLFEAPTVADFAAFIAGRLALAGVSERDEIPRLPCGGELPLSFAQARLWFLDQLAPGGSAYSIAMALRVRGPFDMAGVEAVLGEIVRRHEALRTTFRTVAGEPRQIISPRGAVFLPVIDLAELPTVLWERETERLAGEEARQPFDLSRGPLLRTAVLRQEAGQHAVLLNMHHIVSDGWSLGVLVREFGALYAAFLAGVPSPLPELAIQYVDFAAWQREHLSGALLESELAWWRGQLSGVPPVLDLPADRPRSAAHANRAGLHELTLGSADLAGLESLSRNHGATLFMTLFAGFMGLLQRYTGQDDLAVGMPIAGRIHTEIEPLIGLFVNTLVLRTDLSGNPDFVEILRRVRETALAAYAHQEMPFERLVEELTPERSLNRSPLVQVLFVQYAPVGSLELPGLAVTASQIRAGAAKFELTCTLTETASGMTVALEYSRDLFDGSTMERLAGHFTRLLAGAAAASRQRLAELPLLSETERRQLLDWNAAAPERRGETTLTALFEAQVRRAPDAPAVSFEDDTLSYDELNRRANRLARHLRRLGVGPESRVGVLLERSLEQVVALLGILKSGGAYVPFDPSAPPERLAFLCRDSGIQVLVTDGRGELPPVATAVRLGGPEEGELEADGDGDLPALVKPGHLCYVIYTSGSTGLPKGVQVSHESVSRLLSSTERWFGFGPADVWTLFHSYSFDFSVWELWGALAYGGRLVMVPYWVSRSPEAFWRLLVEEGVTVLNQTPSAFRQLIQADGERTAAERERLALRLVIFGGEALDLCSLGPWYERHAPGAPRLVNMYGITETTVHVSYRPLDVADLAAAHRSPIGVAIPDLGLRLLDARLELVPLGVAGEICVGGAGLARGYLGRPELTAERFVPDPFSRSPGERLYRSGDLARYRPDGELDYLGRGDNQVKVRGFRIEPGEIEAALLEHGKVRSAAVLPRQDSSGGGSLVAYVETAPGGVSAGELREVLGSRLPEYMVPAAFVFVEAMPLTVNGKLDRRALAGLPLEPEERSAARPPRTPAEELVASIFAEVLSLERVGAEDSFFELGGHSLLATQVASRVRTLFGVDLAVREVFEAPTVEALAGRVESQLAGRVGAALPAIGRVPREGRLELSFAQQRLWFLDQLEPGSSMYNIPAAVRLTGMLDRPALAASLAEIVRRHEALRTTFPVVEGQPAQVVSAPVPAGEAVLPLIDLAALPPAARREETRRLIEAAARSPFDLARDPMLRVALLSLAAAEHVVLAVQHHIVSDGWSIGVLTRELAALYAAFTAGAPSPLPELAIQYADYAAWQRRRLTGELLEAELAFWRQRLAGAPAALDLPTDRPRLPVASARGGRFDLALGGEALARLGELSRRHGSTLFMTLLAAFAALLERYTGQETVVVGTPIAGRTTAETEVLIGLFVNTLALRVDLSGSPDFLELLSRVRETALSAYAHQELPFERLVEELAPERDLSRPPLVQAMLVLQNAPAGVLALPGLELEATPVGNGAAAFELTFNFAETPAERPAGSGGDPAGLLAGTIDYNRDLFDASTIARLAGHFERLLADAVASPGTRVADLRLLSDAERQELLAEWGTAPPETPRRTTLAALFAAQVERAPDALAVVLGGEQLTYRELDGRAGRWARRLRRLGVGPETIVGVCLEPSLDLVAAVLAIWRAGGAFLPLDPAYPGERLAFMLEDSGAPLVLTRRGLPGPEAPGVRRVLLDELAADDASGVTAPAITRPENLAYVIYTSGSTGRPKGVAVQQGEAAGHVESIVADWGLSGADRVLQFASPSFDTWIEQTVPPLVSGATLVLRGTELWEPALFLVRIRELGLTVVNPPTAYWLQWVREGLTAETPEAVADLPLRLVWTGGEAMPGEAARLWLRSPLGGILLGNAYGPTEAIVTATCCAVDAAAATAAIVSLGRPLAGRNAHVLDRRGHLTPAGVPGELCLGGALLARGYLHRPDLTAERFVPDPFSPVAGGRLYRTGDLVRASGGRLEYLGRIDQQVKVRGFRIELGEIEAALLEQGEVRSAVVLPRADSSGGGSLVAWVETAPGAVSAAGLRELLKGRLPEYMVPSAFGFLESMPLTPNGKVDRRALTVLPPESGEVGRGEAPRTPIEELVAGIFAEVLKLERVGTEDNFFELGGHSLLATQVASRVRATFRVELAVRAVFEAPTVAALASRIEPALAGGPGEALPAITRVSRERRLELSFAQQRLWFLDRLAPGNPFYNIFGAVRLTGALDAEALRRAFQEIVRRHEALRTTFRLVDGRPVQTIDPDPVFLLSRIDLEAALPEELRSLELGRLANEESQRPFDLGRGPLLRASLIRLGSAEHTLLVNVHHIVSDGWSMSILFHEVATLYGAFSQGKPSPLPELPIQYADFAVWQREHLRGERLEAELDYWRRQLAGIPETLDLPCDHPRPAIESFRGAMHPFVLPAALVRELAALTRRHGATTSMTMLAGFKLLLSRISGRQDIAVGVAIANRTRSEVESLIGFFVNTLVSRSDLAGSPGFARLLELERETALAAYAHQDLPFERLVEELQPERDLSRNPLIQVMFGYQNFPRPEVEIQGLTFSSPEEGQVAARTAKFDLTLFLYEEGDRLVGLLEYNRELFEPATMRRLLDHYENLLAAAVAQPETAVALLPLLSEAERHQLALEWNDTGSAYPADASLQALFEAQARATPDAPALLYGDGELSYGELNRLANRLAHRLRRLGVGPESRVGLCLERSPEMVVGLLGILKAGGAYVPLDPDYPGERLAFMMDDSRLRVLVGEEPAVTRLPGHLVARTDLVLLSAGLTEPDDDPPVTTGGGSLAYVIYTSGSTGRPKGVEVTHRAVARLVRETGYARFGPDEVFLQFAPISFDASTLEVWGALLNGSRLALMPSHALSLQELGRALERYRVTTLWLTAGLFHQFVEHDLELLRPVRQLLAGGDALSAPHVRRVLSALPDTRLINGYGPTENTTFTCCYPMRGAEPIGFSVPLGRPIANTSVHLLDPHGQPVPIGVAGELCAGGDGLARGYLGRPGLTAERFVPNPFVGAHGETPGSRLYRTGDLARHLPDGRIEFLGRIDQQVKIRGFRIEPGEIESRLGEHPAVLQNVVLAREDVPGDRSLVAYVVQNPAYEPPASEPAPEHASQWGEIFDDLYRQEAEGADPAFNVIGWDSSYTGLPLPRNEMEDWLEDTIGRIAALGPRRVLEIGCGTGMILFRIAPRCETYTGTDVSARALDYVERQLCRLEARGIDRSRVHLLQRSAEQLDGMAAGSFDTVILNSVVQYFPSADYLAEVVAQAIALVRPGGSIFLGDLRSLPLLAAFHTSLELFQAEPELPLPRLRQKVQTRRLQENELAVDPAFFAVLRQRLPRIGRVEVYPKRGRHHNELTGFRYQVVLRLAEAEDEKPGEISWLDWQGESLTLAAVRQRLEASRPDILGLRNVPNARVSEAVAAVRLLAEAEKGIETAGDLRRWTAEAAAGGLEPQDFWDLSQELPYEIDLGWASPGVTGSFEAVLRRRDAGAAAAGPAIAALLAVPRAAEPAAAEPLSRYTNNPLQGQFARRIAPELRAFLAARLPEHMVPAAFVLLDALPLSPNGKVDRLLLPAPNVARPEAGPSLVAPRNSTEARLAEIWSELLGIERIGVDDDFFELGGHSLLATQAVSRIREAFGVELALRTFFEAPSVAAVAAEVTGLRLEGGEADAPPIVPAPRDRPLPLSFAQERLWFLHRLDTRTLAYNEAAGFRMEGRLDAGALRWSLDEVLRRHESLRTTFPEVDGRAVQAIRPPAGFEIPLIDLRELPLARRETEARKVALGAATRPFDLARGPLVRGLLVRLGEMAHAVLFSFHHIVFDGWSTGIFVRELSSLYGARIAGAPSPLPPLAVQYADFAVWQRQWLRGEVLERQLAYWRQRLTGVAALGLATDRPRPVLPRAPSGLRFVAMPPALMEMLRTFSRGRGVTLFMTLLAAFQAMLHRYAGQDDVAVGSPIANRDRGEVEPLIGFFVNMLVLRTDLSGDPSFGELLDRVRQVSLGAYAHQGLPFEKLVEELRPERDLRRTPLFQVGFQLLNVPATSLELAGLSLLPLDFAARSAKFDLELALLDGGERLTGLLDYDADLFDAATMERLLAHLERLLAGALESPTTRLSALPLLTRAEHSQVVAEWNDTRTGLPSKLRLQEMFEAQARRTPGVVALVFEAEELRYDELNARANRLANALRRWGVGPGVRVGLCLERSPEMVVGLLGVLKAGGAYVPLDPSYPQDRLAFMLADARVPVLLTQERLLATVFATIEPAPTPRVLCLDVEWAEIEGESAEDPAVLGSVDELAYVIYTSGSTGRPKGAMNSHRAIANRLLWMQQAYGLTGDDRVLQKTPFSFDVSVWEFFWPLATGARLILARPGGHQDPDYLVRLIAQAGITTVHFVPSMLQIFMETEGIELCTSLRRVICSGEALTPQLERRFFSRFPAGAVPALYNLYGPTEAAVDVTAWRCTPESPLATVPIGRPIANTSALVLDAQLGTVPIGIPGELYLGGVQVARGYLDRPDLTAERFIPDPFADPENVGARLYRTGDQVRRLPGGEIVYLGRLDHQVKVRGFRIELGEIEVALSSLAGVREAVVVAREDTPGDPRLVAYVTGDAGVEDLRQPLRERLPEFMVPAVFVHLAALPLNPSGKVDRKALPKPGRGPVLELVAPRNPVEETLAEIWREVLGIERAGIHDNFFEQGGHSLLAVLLMARIEKRFGKALALETLFAAPTMEALAALLNRSGGQARRSPLVAIKPQGEGAPLFCVHPVGGNVLCYLDLARHLAPEQPLYALQSPDPVEGEGLPASIEEMAARYLRELRRIQPEGPYRLGGWSMGGLVAFEMARQLEHEGEGVDLVALIDTPPPTAEPLSPASEEELVAWFATDLARLLGHEAGISPEELRPLPAEEKLGYVAQLAQAMGLLPADFGMAQMRPLFATFAANLQASRSFAPRPYSGSVTLFLSEQTLSARGPELLEGWRRWALGGTEASTLPGDHYSLLRRPQVERLARELTARLAPQLRRNREEGSALVAP